MNDLVKVFQSPKQFNVLSEVVMLLVMFWKLMFQSPKQFNVLSELRHTEKILEDKIVSIP